MSRDSISKASELYESQAQSSASPVPSSSARYSAVEMLDNVGEHEASGFLETLPPDADVNGKEELELQLSDNDETFDGVTMLQQGISSLSMSPRFHGRSSNSKLVSDIFEHRRQTTEYSASPSKQLPPPTLLYKRPEFWSSFPVGHFTLSFLCTFFSLFSSSNVVGIRARDIPQSLYVS